MAQVADTPARPDGGTSFVEVFEPELKAFQTGGMTDTRTFFSDRVYQVSKQHNMKVPWDIGKPQSALACMAQHFQGRVLEVGCGFGDNALWVASLPSVTSITAVDISADAVAAAHSRQASASPAAAAKVVFSTADVFDLPHFASEPFDTLLDCAVFHCVGDDDAQRRYLASVTPRIKMGGKVVLLASSDANPDPFLGPRRVSRAHATAMWGRAGWQVDQFEDVQFDEAYSMHKNPGLALLMLATRVA